MTAQDPTALVRPLPKLFFPDLDVAAKSDLFEKLVDALAEHNVADHGDALLRLLLEREAMGTTAMGWGIALPHVRSHVVNRIALAFARLKTPLDFGATDGAPVTAALLLVAPYGTGGALYPPLLAVLASAVHDEAGRERLLGVAQFEDFERMIQQYVRPRLQEVLAR
ncbi:MAG: PTS sugar transporter subunit IIA [Thermoanaerobaculia bacterium]|nr:PTS sugar transporter subunit IIA [Thermoanaerobaculia bacterium]